MRPDDPPLGLGEPAHRSRRLLQGRGRYVADIRVPGCLEAVFLRSPLGHARILSIDVEAARAMPGVVAVLTGSDIAAVCRSYEGANALYPDLVTPPQNPLAVAKVTWNGEPVVMVVANTRAQGEDAVEAVGIEYEPLTPVMTPEAALNPDIPPIHAETTSNVALRQRRISGDDDVFARAPHAVGRTFRFGRHTGVPLETRGIVADFESGEERLTVHQSHQCPHQMQVEYARLLGVAEHRVRVICPDVGGAFGIKQQLYGDELAVCAASMIIGRPVRFIADRLESLMSDVHAREHVVRASICVEPDGRILGFEIDDLFAIGSYSQHPRSSIGETRTAIGLCGAPYRFEGFRAASTVVFQNKGLSGHYRGVGHPIACAVTEGLVEAAARERGIDPLEFRRRNFIAGEDLPYSSPSGNVFTRLAFLECLEALEHAIDLGAIRREIEEARRNGRICGLGFAAFVEQTARGPSFYGSGRVPVSTRDGCTVRLEPSGVFRCISSVTEQGQGTEMGVRQVIAAALGVATADVEVLTGDTGVTHHGGGTWASRSMAFGGEAAWNAACALRSELLDLAGLLLQLPSPGLDLRGGHIVEAVSGVSRMSLAELGAIAHFRPHELPDGVQPQLVASRTFGPRDEPFRAGCGIQMSYLEVDSGTGLIKLLRHAVVHECGRVVNPLLVDEQIRGGVVQGLGAALFEECLYDEDGQFLSGSLAEYVLPMAGEMPDIEIVHAHGPRTDGEGLGIAGVGEAGTVGAAAAVMNALNDALAASGAEGLYTMPFSPERVLKALGIV